MPPLPLPLVPANHSRTATSPFAFTHFHRECGQLFNIVFIALVAITGLWLATTRVWRGDIGRRGGREDWRYQTPLPKRNPAEPGRFWKGKDQHSVTGEVVPYPWIAPPQPLPGPYDARLYPLPTLRRHSYDPTAIIRSMQEDRIVSYTRRVSAAHISKETRMVHGTVTTSAEGWRRNQWSVSGT